MYRIHSRYWERWSAKLNKWYERGDLLIGNRLLLALHVSNSLLVLKLLVVKPRCLQAVGQNLSLALLYTVEPLIQFTSWMEWEPSCLSKPEMDVLYGIQPFASFITRRYNSALSIGCVSYIMWNLLCNHNPQTQLLTDYYTIVLWFCVTGRIIRLANIVLYQKCFNCEHVIYQNVMIYVA